MEAPATSRGRRSRPAHAGPTICRRAPRESGSASFRGTPSIACTDQGCSTSTPFGACLLEQQHIERLAAERASHCCVPGRRSRCAARIDRSSTPLPLSQWRPCAMQVHATERSPSNAPPMPEFVEQRRLLAATQFRRRPLRRGKGSFSTSRDRPARAGQDDRGGEDPGLDLPPMTTASREDGPTLPLRLRLPRDSAKAVTERTRRPLPPASSPPVSGHRRCEFSATRNPACTLSTASVRVHGVGAETADQVAARQRTPTSASRFAARPARRGSQAMAAEPPA